MKKFYLFILLFPVVALRAQDIHFSQQTETPLFLSPANTGFFNGYFRATANYRNQWAAMNKAFVTEAVAIDGGVFRMKKHAAFMGIGLTFFNDQAGVAKLRRTNVMLNLSGIVKLGKKSALSVGAAIGTTGTNANYANLTYEEQFKGNYLDPTAYSGETPYRQFTTLDVGAGIAYEYATYKRDQDHDDVQSFKIALGAYHLNKPVQDFGAGSSYAMPVRYTAAFNSVLDVEDTKFTLTPMALYHRQATFSELYFGSYIKYRMKTGTKVTGAKTQNAIGFGLFYRNEDAIIPGLIFDINDFTIALSYDVNVSGYTFASNRRGGLEVALRYNMLASSLFETKREYR